MPPIEYPMVCFGPVHAPLDDGVEACMDEHAPERYVGDRCLPSHQAHAIALHETSILRKSELDRERAQGAIVVIWDSFQGALDLDRSCPILARVRDMYIDDHITYHAHHYGRNGQSPYGELAPSGWYLVRAARTILLQPIRGCGFSASCAMTSRSRPLGADDDHDERTIECSLVHAMLDSYGPPVE